jgi:glycosyltransferase involved in cell wall biosynthesis
MSAGPAARAGRVLFVIGTLDVGGTETQLATLATGLVRRGWQVEVFALRGGGPLAARLQEGGVTVIDGRDPLDRASNPRRIASLAACELRLAWHIVRTRPDVVHAFLPFTNFIGAVAGRLAFAPLVITSRRALGNHRIRQPGFAWMDGVANALSHVVTANSRAVAEDVQAREGYDRDRIVVIPNGLDLGRFEAVAGEREAVRRELGLGADDVALVKVANLIPYKGHADLIEAMAMLGSGQPGPRLFLIGSDRAAGDALRAEVERRRLSGRVVFLGYRDDVPRLLAGMDVGVVASHEEGSSNALIEQLAAGLPLVATRVGGNVEAVEDVADCLLVPARDPAALAAAITRAIEALPESATRRSERQESVRMRHSLPEMIGRYERLYRRGRER